MIALSLAMAAEWMARLPAQMAPTTLPLAYMAPTNACTSAFAEMVSTPLAPPGITMQSYSSALPPPTSASCRSGTILTPREHVTYATECAHDASLHVLDDPTNTDLVVTDPRTRTSYVIVNSLSSVPSAIKINADGILSTRVFLFATVKWNVLGEREKREQRAKSKEQRAKSNKSEAYVSS